MNTRRTPAIVVGIVGALLLIGCLVQAQSQSKGKEQDLRRLLNLTAAKDVYDRILTVTTLRLTQSGLSKVADEYVQEAKLEDLVEAYLPLYAQSLSESDVKELLKFFDSPTGKRYLAMNTRLQSELAPIAEKWSQDIIARLSKREGSAMSVLRQRDEQNACINNLRKLDAAKEMASIEKNIPEGTVPQDSLIDDVLKREWKLSINNLKCPGGGKYVVGKMGVNPSCSVHGDAMKSMEKK